MRHRKWLLTNKTTGFLDCFSDFHSIERVTSDLTSFKDQERLGNGSSTSGSSSGIGGSSVLSLIGYFKVHNFGLRQELGLLQRNLAQLLINR